MSAREFLPGLRNYPGFPDNWHLRSGGYSSPHPEENYYRNQEWREAGNKIRDWRDDPTLNAMGQNVTLRGDILHHIPIAERLERWRKYRGVFPMSRPPIFRRSHASVGS